MKKWNGFVLRLLWGNAIFMLLIMQGCAPGVLVDTNQTPAPAPSSPTTSIAIGGGVSGLSGAGLVLQHDGGGNLQVNPGANSFTFADTVAPGTSYNVTVLAQPANPSLTCIVTNASGTAGANIAIQVSCTTNTYSISGTVSGLIGAGLVLQDSKGNTLPISSSATSFAFGTPMASGDIYNVIVLTQPSFPAQTCVVSNASGSVTIGNVTSLQVACTKNFYTIGGTVSGLIGAGLVLQDNGGNNLTLSAGAANFTFSTNIASSATYNVAVFSQPSFPSQTCAVANASGPVTNANITNVQVTCTSMFVYVSNERANTISAYSAATNGNLTELATSPFTTGFSPEGLAVDPTEKFLYVANVLANNVSGYSIAADGSLSPIPGSPFATGTSGAISVAFDPTGKFLYVPSCGANCSGTDSGGMAAFAIAQNGALTLISGSPFTTGQFPYEMAFFAPAGGTSGPFAYLANSGSNNISAYAMQATGALSAISGSPFAAGTRPLALAVDANAAFPRVFVVNTQSNNLSIYAIQADGSPLLVSGSPIAIGSFAGSVVEDANQHLYVAGGAGVYAYSASTALPSLIAGSPFAAGTGPNQLRIDPGGHFVYVVNAGSNTVSGYSINSTNGVLSPLPGTPFATGNFPHYITFATR